MSFLTFSNVKMNVNNRQLRWRFYTAAEIFLTTNQVKVVENIEFVIVSLNLEDEIFIAQ